MPKLIDVSLEKISCSKNALGDPVVLSGNIFGATFDDPSTLKSQADIFSFPSDGITIGQGDAVPLARPSEADITRFTLIAPSQNAPGSAPQFLKFGGTLNNDLGSQFATIRFDEALPFLAQPGETQVPPRKFDVAFSNRDVAVTLTFGLLVAEVF